MNPLDEDGDFEGPQTTEYIRIHQHSGRRTLTRVEGKPESYDMKKILKALKQILACQGALIVDSELV